AVMGSEFASWQEKLKSDGGTAVIVYVPDRAPASSTLFPYTTLFRSPSDEDLKKQGFTVVDSHEFDGGGLLLAESKDPLTAASVTALGADAGAPDTGPDRVPSIPRTT